MARALLGQKGSPMSHSNALQSVGAPALSTADVHGTLGVLRHLHRLTGAFPSDGQRIGYVRVYARLTATSPASVLHRMAPAIAVYPADDQGFEGIACVDDVARAATLALRVYE